VLVFNSLFFGFLLFFFFFFSFHKQRLRIWMNSFLETRGMSVKDLRVDLKDGTVLVNLLEILSGVSVGRYYKNPMTRVFMIENCVIFMEKARKNHGINMTMSPHGLWRFFFFFFFCSIFLIWCG